MSICSKTLQTLDQPPCTLTVVFAGPWKMRVLNRRYRGKDYATDVLSFGYDGESDEGLDFLGEVIISPEVASENARRWNSSPEREVRKLLVHGVLHLLGFDHETDRGEMNRLQQRLLRRRFLMTSARILRRG